MFTYLHYISTLLSMSRAVLNFLAPTSYIILTLSNRLSNTNVFFFLVSALINCGKVSNVPLDGGPGFFLL